MECFSIFHQGSGISIIAQSCKSITIHAWNLIFFYASCFFPTLLQLTVVNNQGSNFRTLFFRAKLRVRLCLASTAALFWKIFLWNLPIFCAQKIRYPRKNLPKLLAGQSRTNFFNARKNKSLKAAALRQLITLGKCITTFITFNAWVHFKKWLLLNIICGRDGFIASTARFLKVQFGPE